MAYVSHHNITCLASTNPSLVIPVKTGIQNGW